MKTTRAGGVSDAGMLIGRIALVALFLRAGWGKLMSWPGIVHLLVHLGAPFPRIGGVVAIACELGGGILIVIGLRTRLVALVMIAFIAGATWFAHRFWTMHGPAAFDAEINFFKNLAIIGGFLLLASAGPGRFSIDRG